MALKCEPVIPADQLPRLPLPVGRQRWIVELRARPDATDAEVLRAVRNLMQQWLPLFEGRPGEPMLFDPEDADEQSIAQPPALTVRAPSRLVGVEFDWEGPGVDMRWPTFTQRRRERIDPLCPVQHVDAMPVAALAPDELSDDDEPLEQPPDHFNDPLDLGLGPVDPDAIRRAFRVTFGATALIGGLLIAGLVVSRLRGASK